jgi:hypothetical protein
MRNIKLDPYGYRVVVERCGIKLDAFVRFGHDRAAALKKAVIIRDDFLAQHARWKPRSNTGVAGVTELVHWTGGKPRSCFQVTAGSPRPGWMRRFFYETFADRQRQFVRAIKHRARLAGENVEQLLEAAHV